MNTTTRIKSIKEAPNWNCSYSWLKQCNQNSNLQNIHQNNGIIVQLATKNTCTCNKDIERLESEIKHLKAAIKDKEHIIALLERD